MRHLAHQGAQALSTTRPPAATRSSRSFLDEIFSSLAPAASSSPCAMGRGAGRVGVCAGGGGGRAGEAGRLARPCTPAQALSHTPTPPQPTSSFKLSK